MVNKIIPYIFFQSFLLGLIGCDNGSSVNGKAGPSDTNDEEEESADEPVQVSGAYLTCDWLAPDSIDSGASSTIGCAIVDKGGNTFDRNQRNFSLTLYNDDDTKASMTTSEAASGSRWHQLAELPRTHRKTGYLKMSMKKSSTFEGNYIQRTYDIGTNSTLGRVLDGEPILLGETETIVLKSITTHSNWKGLPVMVGTGSFLAADFCDSAGVLRNQVSVATAAIIDQANEKIDAGFKKDITIGDTVFKLGAGRCFDPFKLTGGSDGENYAHQNSDGKCFVLVSGGIVHTISIVKNHDPELTLTNLQQFATRQQCIN